MLSSRLKHILEIIVGDDEDCDECDKDKDEYREKDTRGKVYDSGGRKMWMPTSSGNI
jgi:hypothetical protein